MTPNGGINSSPKRSAPDAINLLLAFSLTLPKRIRLGGK